MLFFRLPIMRNIWVAILRLLRITALLMAIIIVGMTSAFVASADGDGNLLLNPSFEQMQADKPADWGTVQWNTDSAASSFRLVSGEARYGQISAQIVNTQGNDARYVQEVAVSENQAYRISGWIKTVDVGAGNRGANLSVEGKVETSSDVRGTSNGWQYVELYVYVHPGVHTMKVTAGIGAYGDTNTGTAYFDDIRAEAVASVPPDAVKAQLGEAQSPEGLENQTVSGNGYRQGPSSFLYFLLVAQVVIVCSALLHYFFRVRQRQI